MIKERYCSLEVAKLLKEKGFDEPCDRFYKCDSTEIYRGYVFTNTQIGDRFYNAPTHQMAMDWLREIHSIFIEISISIDLNGKYHFSYTILDKECKYVRRGYTDFDWNYEEAVEAALKYCLTELI